MFAKYLAIYYFFETQVFRVTRVPEAQVIWKIAFKFAVLFFMKLKLHKKMVAIFYGTRVCGTQVTWQTQVSQTWVLKKWLIPHYFTISGKFIYILPRVWLLSSVSDTCNDRNRSSILETLNGSCTHLPNNSTWPFSL